MTVTDLQDHARLERLDPAVAAMTARLTARQALFHPDHALSARAIGQRHEVLRAEVASQIADAAAHGRRIGALEKSVLAWVDALDAST